MKNSILKYLISVSNQRLLLPFYHMVSNDENTFANYLYPPRKIALFKNDLDVLLQHYEPISMEELIRLTVANKPLKRNVFHLTFDDGLANFYEVVAPILKEKNIPATVFINTNFVDNKALFYRYKASLLVQEFKKSSNEKKKIFQRFFNSEETVEKLLLAINYKNKELLDVLATKVHFSFSNYLTEKRPYLSTVQISELINNGFTIGAHSKNHPLFSEISLEEQLKETQESMQWLQEKFKINYCAFSFPFTDLGVSKHFFKEIVPMLDISFGTSGIKNDAIATNFQRISFELGNENSTSFLVKSYIKYLLKIPFGKHIMPRG